jgi:hypothetical protein
MELKATPESALEILIVNFFDLNPTPADAQIHALAGAIGVDKETLESVIYKMFGEQQHGEQTAILDPEQTSSEDPIPQYATTMVDRLLQDDIDPEDAPTNRVTTTDGWLNNLKDTLTKTVTYSDGAPVVKALE